MPTTYAAFISECLDDGMSKTQAEVYWLEVNGLDGVEIES